MDSLNIEILSDLELILLKVELKAMVQKVDEI